MTCELTIVTGTRHRPESLQRWFQSAVKAATVPTRVIIADASDVFVPRQLFAEGMVVETSQYHESPRRGVNHGYDALVRRSTTEFVAFFNDDAELVPGWDRIALDFMRAHPEVGIGCLYWNDPGGTPYLQDFRGFQYPNFGIIRKSAGDDFGWFDTREVYVPELDRMESLQMYGMDCGIALKAIDKGYAVVGIPACRVMHHREQDAERAANNAKYVLGPQGNLAGRILWLLWNGDSTRMANEGFEYGWRQLREKAERWKHLESPINARVEGLGTGHA